MLLIYLDSQLILNALTRLGLNFPTPPGDLITAHANTLDRDKDKTALARSLFSQLSWQQVKKLYQQYEIDFLMFDYSIEPYLSYAQK